MPVGFNSINSLFLISLAIVSWIILLFLKNIEETERIHDDLNMDRVMGQVAGSAKAATTQSPLNYELYLNVLCIFACIYGLSKITHLTENYIVRRLHSKFGYGQDDEESKAINDFRANLQKLRTQIACLEKNNAALERRVQQQQETILENYIAGEKYVSRYSPYQHQTNMYFSKPSLYIQPEAFAQYLTGEGGLTSSLPNLQQSNMIFSKRPLQIHRQAYSGCWTTNDESKDATQIWQKYLEVQQSASRMRDKSPLNSAAATPTIMSLDNLRNGHGLY